MQPSELMPRQHSVEEVPQEIDWGFSRQKRLLNGRDFKQVFEHAKRLNSPLWTLYVWRHELNKTQLGLAIAKRSVKRAHERNRLKRLARETFRQMQNQLVGINYIVMASHAAQFADNSVLVDSLTQLFNQSIRYRQSPKNNHRTKS